MMILRTVNGFSWPLHPILGYSDLEMSPDNSVSSFSEHEKCFRQDKNYGEMASSQDKQTHSSTKAALRHKFKGGEG